MELYLKPLVFFALISYLRFRKKVLKGEENMIYTLTTNPAVDMCVTADEIKYGGATTRTKNAFWSANGKGINVSRVLKHFGQDSKVLGFFGGFSGNYIIDELKKDGFSVIPVMTDGITRVNTFLSLPYDEIKLVNEGSKISKENESEMLALIKSLDDCEILVISGSLSKGMTDEFYFKLLEILKEKKVKTVFDISSPCLKEILKYNPWLIKPNDEELFDIFGYKIDNEEDAKTALLSLYEMGAQNVLITLGGKGSYFFNGKDMYFTPSVNVKLKNSVCAGDSFLAAFISEYIKDNIEKALILASATGANVSESAGIGDLKKVCEYAEFIKIRRIK